MPSWKKVIISGSSAELSSVYAPSITGSLQGTSSFAVTASYALTSSFSLATTENRILVLNQSGYTISKGIVVHITGSNNASDIPRVVSASYESDAYSANTLGIASETITNGNQGYVTTEGVLAGIDTSAFTSGQLVYLGAAGSIVGTSPLAPLHSVRLGQIVREQSINGSMYVRIDNGYELGELHDVIDSTTTTSHGDLLVKSGSVWTTSKQLTGSYGLTGSLNIGPHTSPSYTSKIHVAKYPNPSGSLTAGTGSILYNYGVSDGIAVFGAGDSDLFKVINEDTNTQHFSINDLGYVGIGKTAITGSYTPTNAHLDVNGNAIITGSATITGSLNVTGSYNMFSNESETQINLQNQTNGFQIRHFLRNSDATYGIYDTNNAKTFFRYVSSSIANNTKMSLMEYGGSVGIGIGGIDLPIISAKLHINNTSTTASFLVEDTTNPDASPFIIDSFLVEDSTNPDASPFVIDKDGNVGVGTETLTSALSTDARVLAIRDTAPSNNVGTFRAYGGGTLTSIELFAAPSLVGLYGSTDTPMIFSANSAERMRINANGNVGIGTTNPIYLLEVKETASAGFVTVGRFSGGVNATGSGGGIIFASSQTETGAIYGYQRNHNSGDLVFMSRDNAVNLERMRILSSGQLNLDLYTGSGAFPGSAAGYLAVDTTGNIITTAGVGSAVNIGNSDLTITTDATRVLSHSGTSRLIISGSTASERPNLELVATTLGQGRVFNMSQKLNGEVNRSAVRSFTVGGTDKDSYQHDLWANDHIAEFVSGSAIDVDKLKGWSWSYYNGVDYSEVLLISTSNAATLNANLLTTGSVRFTGIGSGTTANAIYYDTSTGTITYGSAGGNVFPYTGSALITGSLGITGSFTVGTDNNQNFDSYGFVFGSGSYLNGVIGNDYKTYSAILGGELNKIHTQGTRNVILGGILNNITGSGPGGGHSNSVIVGGTNNRIDAQGESENELIAASTRSTITGGFELAIIASDSASIGNANNSAIIGSYGSRMINTPQQSVIIGGEYNLMPSVYRSVILGGSQITASSNDTVYMPNVIATGSVQFSGLVAGTTTDVVYIDSATGDLTYGPATGGGGGSIMLLTQMYQISSGI